LLWDVTVEGLRWYKEKVRPESDLPWFFLTKHGRPLTAPTKGNNRSQQIPNCWGRVLKRIHKDQETFRKLSFNKLRKTSSNWIRRKFGKEIADLFLGHGPAEIVDAYTDKRYAELYRAIRRYGRFLAPVFAVIERPFPDPVGGRTAANLKITPGKKRHMQELRDQGFTMKQVAKMEGVAVDTVRRYTVNPLKKNQPC
jgi:hypothetical protein